jgi:hypothetical protein
MDPPIIACCPSAAGQLGAVSHLDRIPARPRGPAGASAFCRRRYGHRAPCSQGVCQRTALRGVRSSHSYTAYRWGHTWGVVSVLVQLPRATRPWALPVLVALSRPREWNRVRGTRHKTPAHLARLLLARLVRWFPKRPFTFVGDAGDGTSATARFCRQRHHHLTLVSTCYGDAALYEPPPPRTGPWAAHA